MGIKNIAIIVSKLNGGGAERIAGLLSYELSKKYNVYVFLLDVKNIIYKYGGQIVDLSEINPLLSEYSIRENKKRYNIDVSISFLEPLNFANLRTGGKVIISERSVQSMISPSLAAEQDKILKYYSYADKIVSCAHGVKYDLVNNYYISDQLIETIYNFIDKETIKEKAKKCIDKKIKTFLNDNPYFINIGRLHEQKNQQRLIAGFKVFLEKYKRDIKLLILGDGQLKEKLEKQIENEGLENDVMIASFKTNPYPYLSASKGLIVSSIYEGLPNVILEAMTLGIPIISNDCLSGPRELLGDMSDYSIKFDKITILERGILIPNVEVSGYLADAMEMLVSDEDLWMKLSQKSLQYMESYSNEDILRQWIEVIENVTKDKSKCEVDITKIEEEELAKKNNIFIYGAGKVGKRMFLQLHDKYNIKGFVVTDENSIKSRIMMGKPMYSLTEIKKHFRNPAFIMGVDWPKQDEIVRELKKYDFEDVNYIMLNPIPYELKNGDGFCEQDIIDFYAYHTSKLLDLSHPVTFNEKIQWLKINDNLPIKTALSDKILVRKYVEEIIGVEYLIPILGEWEKFDDIDFEKLPDKFVLKCNHASGTNLIVNSKNELDIPKEKSVFDKWMAQDYSKENFEFNYRNIHRKILAEKLLETNNGEDLIDYKLHVFNGKVRLIQVDIDRHHNHRRNLYLPDWTYLPYSILYPTASEINIEKPGCLDEMIDLAQKLGKQFIYVRVDFYINKDQIWFGEMTFYHGSGCEIFRPQDFEYEMGTWIDIDSCKRYVNLP